MIYFEGSADTEEKKKLLLDKLLQLWIKYPDHKFGQLVFNVAYMCSDVGIFHIETIEDGELANCVDKYDEDFKCNRDE